MIRTGLKCKDMVRGIDELMNKGLAQAFSIDSTEFMDVEDFMLYKGLMKSYKELMDVTTAVCEQMDEQSKMLEELQNDMKDLKKEIKVTQDGIYELTNKVEEVIEKDEEKDTRKKG